MSTIKIEISCDDYIMAIAKIIFHINCGLDDLVEDLNNVELYLYTQEAYIGKGGNFFEPTVDTEHKSWPSRKRLVEAYKMFRESREVKEIDMKNKMNIIDFPYGYIVNAISSSYDQWNEYIQYDPVGYIEVLHNLHSETRDFLKSFMFNPKSNISIIS